jgi:hypothetical protein
MVQEMPLSEQTTAQEKPRAKRITLATKSEAEAATASLKADFQKFTAAWWEMGKRVKDALDRQVPAALGMNAYDWMKAVFGDTASVAKIQRSLKIARALNGIPEEKVQLLTEGKAYLLTLLKEPDRAEFVDQAIVATNEQFKEMVEQRRIEYGITPDEKRVHLGVSLPESVAGRWGEAEKKVARLHDLDIELKPGLRIQVFEIIAEFILQTPDEVLMAEMVGGGI